MLQGWRNRQCNRCADLRGIRIKLTPVPGTMVKAPVAKGMPADLQRKLVDARLVRT